MSTEHKYCCDKLKRLEELGTVTIYSDGVVNEVDCHSSDEWPTKESNELRFLFCPYCGEKLL